MHGCSCSSFSVRRRHRQQHPIGDQAWYHREVRGACEGLQVLHNERCEDSPALSPRRNHRGVDADQGEYAVIRDNPAAIGGDNREREEKQDVQHIERCVKIPLQFPQNRIAIVLMLKQLCTTLFWTMLLPLV